MAKLIAQKRQFRPQPFLFDVQRFLIFTIENKPEHLCGNWLRNQTVCSIIEKDYTLQKVMAHAYKNA